MQRFKAQTTLLSKTYKKHVLISTITRIEILPPIDGSTEFVVPWPCNGETEGLHYLYNDMDKCWMLNWLGSSSNVQLPWMKLTLTVQDFARMWWFLASIFFRKASGWWNQQRSSKFYGNFSRKMKNKSWENVQFSDLDLFEWSVNPKFS